MKYKAVNKKAIIQEPKILALQAKTIKCMDVGFLSINLDNVGSKFRTDKMVPIELINGVL